MQSKLNKYLLKNRKNYQVIALHASEQEDKQLDNIGKILSNGAEIIELQAKNFCAKNFLSIAEKVRELTGVFGALLIIYDRIDIAKLVNADGILLDKNSMPVKAALKLTEGSILIGFYADNEKELLNIEDGVDFITSKKILNNKNIKSFVVKF